MKNPRYVWAIGSIREQFPDIPEFDEAEEGVVLWDRQEKCKVVSVSWDYAQAFCLETTNPGDSPLSDLADWFQSIGRKAALSENLVPNKREFSR